MKKKLPNKYYKNLRKEIKLLGLKISFIAERIGVSREYLSRALNGKEKYSESLLQKVNFLISKYKDAA